MENSKEMLIMWRFWAFFFKIFKKPFAFVALALLLL
jgi:hypothetical protein